MPGGKLSPRQQAFVDEYIVSLNATQAAIKAGYSAKTADVQGPRLLGNVGVAAAIAAAKQARSERTEITADNVLRELAAVAFAHMGQYATWNDDRVSLTDSSEVDPRAVSEVKQTVNQFGNNVSIKLHDKLGALAKLGDHLGLWKKEPELTGGGLEVVITDKRGTA